MRVRLAMIWAATSENVPPTQVRPAKIQISLRIRAVWSESSLGAFSIDKGTKFLHADYDNSDQTARMRRLIRVFVERTCQTVRFLPFGLILLHSGSLDIL